MKIQALSIEMSPDQLSLVQSKADLDPLFRQIASELVSSGAEELSEAQRKRIAWRLGCPRSDVDSKLALARSIVHAYRDQISALGKGIEELRRAPMLNLSEMGDPGNDALMLGLFMPALERALAFRPRSSMEDNWAMASLDHQLDQNGAVGVLSAYMRVIADEGRERLSPDVHGWFLDRIMGSGFGLGERDADALAKLPRLPNLDAWGRGRLEKALLRMFIVTGVELRRIWEPSLLDAESAVAMSDMLLEAHPPLAGEIKAFIAECKARGLTAPIENLRSRAASWGGEMERAIDEALGA
jgi:hypothetical protein